LATHLAYHLLQDQQIRDPVDAPSVADHQFLARRSDIGPTHWNGPDLVLVHGSQKQALSVPVAAGSNVDQAVSRHWMERMRDLNKRRTWIRKRCNSF
jgi:hypothetical protein